MISTPKSSNLQLMDSLSLFYQALYFINSSKFGSGREKIFFNINKTKKISEGIFCWISSLPKA